MVVSLFRDRLFILICTDLLSDFYSFNEGGTMNSFTGFTWENYEAVFEDTRLIIIVLNTFMLAFLSALIATIIGTFGAMGIYYTKNDVHGQRC